MDGINLAQVGRGFLVLIVLRGTGAISARCHGRADVLKNCLRPRGSPDGLKEITKPNQVHHIPVSTRRPVVPVRLGVISPTA